MWLCSCPLCRLLVHPVLRRAGVLENQVERITTSAPSRESTSPSVPREAPSPEYSPGAEPPTTPSTLGSTPSIAIASLETQLSSLVEDTVNKLANSIRDSIESSNKVLIEHLDRLEETIGKLRKELKDLVSGMEDMMVEFREALSNFNNPFIGGAENGKGVLLSTLSTHPSSGSLVALLPSLRQLIDRVGLSAVEELIGEYQESGILGEEEARKLRAIARTVAKLRGREIDEKLLIPLLHRALENQ